MKLSQFFEKSKSVKKASKQVISFVNETIENPASLLKLPALSIVPTLVELASLVNDVPAFQFHET